MNDQRETLGQPDWVMIGVPAPAGGVCLLASKTLTDAELRYRSDELDRFWFERQVVFPPPPSRRWCELEARMDDFVMIYGATYADCLAGLAQHWQPDQTGGTPRRRPSPVAGIRRELGGS